jgi:hypothetical protein
MRNVVTTIEVEVKGLATVGCTTVSAPPTGNDGARSLPATAWKSQSTEMPKGWGAQCTLSTSSGERWCSVVRDAVRGALRERQPY